MAVMLLVAGLLVCWGFFWFFFLVFQHPADSVVKSLLGLSQLTE